MAHEDNGKSAPSWRKLAAYASPSLPLAALGLPLVVHLPSHYAQDLGVSLGAVSLAFMLVRLVDIFFDPLLGWLMDRTRTPLGRFRPWLIAATPLLMLASYMLFMAKPGVGAAYLWFWLLVGYLGFSMGSLSQTAWGAVLSPDYNQRSRIYGWWQTGNVLGMLLILGLTPLLESGLHLPHPAGIHGMGWFVVLLMPLTVALAASSVGEPVKASPHGGRLSDYLHLFRNASVRNLLVSDLLLGWAPAITGALFLFYFEQIKHVSREEANLLLLVYFVSGLLGAPLWTGLALKVGKHRALAVVCGVIIVSLLLLMAAPFTSLPLRLVVMVLGGLPFSGGALLLRAMLADVGDEIRLEGGIDRTGLLYSVFTGTRKVGDMLAVGTFAVLGWLGFDPNSAGNGPGALMGLQLLFIGLPCLLSALAAVVILRYPLTADRHAQIRAELDWRGESPASA
jgi:GPH family glycoside/pentoside/hexuronide:cation symporter